MTQKNSPQKSQFQLIQEKRLKQIQQKLNATCCQYDSLMPLLEMLDFIPQISMHQKQLKNIQKRIKSCQDRLKSKDFDELTNTYRSKNLYEYIQEAQLCTQTVKRQLFEFESATRQKKSQSTKQEIDRDSSYAYNQSILRYENYLQQLLAQYKTQMDIQFSKCQNLSPSEFRLGDREVKAIKEQFRSVDQILQNIDNDIQLTKGQLSTQNLLKFHQFNYHRIQYEIITISQNIDFMKEEWQINKTQKQFFQKHNQMISQVKQALQKCKWQIIGSKKYYLRQLSKLYSISKDLYQTNKMQLRISQEFQQVQNLFKKLALKFNQYLTSSQ